MFSKINLPYAALLYTLLFSMLANSAAGAKFISGDPNMTNHPYIGMWVTEDGHIRHNLQSNGRYVEARGKRERAYEGRYRVTGNYIEYWDDTGFTADGEFIDGVLYHAGMVLTRKE
ncbi:Atu4866 domain-containing protein [Halomonas sp. GT]|uniref:Atu4866 domain-containing protein n=1 Tax=Halomonas sp. GT TaxID=1971364 RepID=UPI0009F18C8A|nr:Atu4866 domain-containing protein [Halomonas sp. GT]